MHELIQDWYNFWIEKANAARTSAELVQYKKQIESESRTINKALFAKE